MPSNVTTIGKEPFKGCDALTTLNVSESTDATMLTELIIGATAIETVIIPVANQSIKDENGVIYSYDNTILVVALPKMQAAELIIPATVTTISANAFASTTTLKKVSFAAGTESLTIADNVFAGCNLESIVLPARLNGIFLYAVSNCPIPDWIISSSLSL